MKPQTRDDQIENCLVAMAMMQEVPASRLVPRLASWANTEMIDCGVNHCGSAACFGGWIALTPYFQKKGVYPHVDTGQPLVEGIRAHKLPEVLFGIFSDSMFDPCWRGNERTAIRRRLENALERLLET